MPKRNLVLLCLLALACMLAWAARRSAGTARVFGEVAGHVRRAYVEPVDADVLLEGALEGMFARLDGQTSLLSAEDARSPRDAGEGAFAGVGLEVTLDEDRRIAVATPVVGAAAFAAGIAAGDRIVAIDGVRTSGMRLRDAVAALRGEAGTTVVVDVAPPRGDAAESFDERGEPAASRTVSLVRGTIRPETVWGDRRRADGSWHWSLEGEEGIALVRITGFGPGTLDELDRACAEIAAAGTPRGIVVDLRGNGTGAFAVAADVSDRFLEDGVIVSTRRRSSRTQTVDERRAAPGAVFAGVPMAVLVDGLTAGAAEIVAASLQDSGRAIVVGSRTFGRGTAHSLVPLSDGRTVLRLTTAEYLRPGGASLHRRPHHTEADNWGVVPDDGAAITPTGSTLEAVNAWRVRRDAVPRHDAASVASQEEASHASLPRAVDPVLARALVALGAGGVGDQAPRP